LNRKVGEKNNVLIKNYVKISMSSNIIFSALLIKTTAETTKIYGWGNRKQQSESGTKKVTIEK
jgi:hypothetical protein